jgi:hypothetical protein
MRTSSLKKGTLAVVWGIGLAGGTLGMGANTAEAQTQAVSQSTLSPGAQRVLRTILSVVPADAERLMLQTVAALGPERAEARLSALQALPPAALQTIGRNMVGILGVLQPQYRQAFVNGVFQVSVAEVQFASGVVYQVTAAQRTMAAQAAAAAAAQAQAAQAPAQAMLPQQAMNAENQAAIAAQIMATQQRIYQLNQRGLMEAHMNTMNIGDGWIRALGTTPYPLRVTLDP